MDVLTLASAIGLPLLMFVGGMAAWRISKSRQFQEDEQRKEGWRDTSLDDWRRERDEAADRERQQRSEVPQADLTTGRAEEQEVTQRQQRIGG